MLEEVVQRMPKETGGVLMGYKSQKSICITAVIGPGPKAIHERHSFSPDNDYHIAEIAKIFKQTNGQITYLGDWHSHPDAAAYLSQKDKRAISSIAGYKDALLPEPIMIVIGTFPFEIKAWIFKTSSYSTINQFKEVAVEFISKK